MDFSTIPNDTLNILSYDPSDQWTDHVKWQGSQTACSALNQLIKSSVNETTRETPRISGWQRVSSYDQLSSFNSTGTVNESSFLSSHPRPSSSKPTLSSRLHSRARLSEARAPAPDTTTNLDLPIPLFNKANPMQFLDIMKGVSARLDENAGVRPRKEFNPGDASSSSRPKKRSRGVSLGGTSGLQGGRATRGVVKKGRVDELRTSGNLTGDEGKGNGRLSEDEGLGSEVRGRGLQTHSSLPDIPSRSDLKRSLSSKDMSFMDVDDKDDDMDAGHVSISSSSNHGHLDTPFSRTLSQTQMPPPPLACGALVYEQCQPAADPRRQQSNVPPLAVSRYSNSINKPQTSYPPPQQPPPTNHSITQRNSDAIPRLHPLLYHKPTTTGVSTSSTATSMPQVQPHSAPIPASEGINLKPPPSSFTPMFSSTPSSRPPPLGMRRNHTFLSRASSLSNVQQESSSLTGSGGQLPQRQKGFKPPLLSLSQPQPQTQTQTHGLSQAKVNANTIVVESGSTIATSKKVSSHNLLEASSTDILGFNTTADTSMALRSSSSSSDSSTSFRSTPPTISSAPSSSHPHPSDSSVYSTSKKSKQGMAQHDVQQPQEWVVIPEPLDGDADSSFGDMSFDMDALEETMKMYD